MGKGFDKFLNMIRLNDEEYDEYDDYDDFDEGYEDDFDDIPAPVVKKKTFKKETQETRKESKTAAKKTSRQDHAIHSVPSASHASSRGKIVPMKSTTSRGEVCVLRPTVFEDSREIKMFYYPAEPLLLIWKALIWKLPSELLILFRVPVMPWPEISKKFQIIFLL